MSYLLNLELDHLKQALLHMSAQVERDVEKSLEPLCSKCREPADAVLASEEEVDVERKAIEEECLKIIALHQPAAGDLRFIVSAQKIDRRLERIGDLAKKMAKNALILLERTEHPPILAYLQTMGERSRHILHESLRAFVNLDGDRAAAARRLDDEVDAMQEDLFRQTIELLRKNGEDPEPLVRYNLIGHCLERIADHAGCIAKDTIYILHGVHA